jgi:hypothetical protein
MKLTETQHKNIINYLINEGLEYKEFIDEMTDHFIDSIEAKMGEGMSFFYALEETGNAFRNEIYYPFPLNVFPKKGLKALEKRFYESKKREIDAELKSNFKTSFFSIPNALVLCYVALVYYLFQDGSIQQNYTALILFWMFPGLLFSGYLRRRLKVPIDNACGLGWLFASKKQRVRSVHINLLLHVSGGVWLGLLAMLSALLHFANKYNYISNATCLYAILFFITLTLLAQVQVIKMIPRANKLINN